MGLGAGGSRVELPWRAWRRLLNLLAAWRHGGVAIFHTLIGGLGSPVAPCDPPEAGRGPFSWGPLGPIVTELGLIGTDGPPRVRARRFGGTAPRFVVQAAALVVRASTPDGTEGPADVEPVGPDVRASSFIELGLRDDRPVRLPRIRDPRSPWDRAPSRWDRGSPRRDRTPAARGGTRGRAAAAPGALASAVAGRPCEPSVR